MHPARMKVVNKKGFLKNYLDQKSENMKPRQSLDKIYIRSGDIYLITKKAFLNNQSLVGNKVFPYIFDTNKTINIDSSFDFEVAKLKLKSSNSL